MNTSHVQIRDFFPFYSLILTSPKRNVGWQASIPREVGEKNINIPMHILILISSFSIFIYVVFPNVQNVFSVRTYSFAKELLGMNTQDSFFNWSM